MLEPHQATSSRHDTARKDDSKRECRAPYDLAVAIGRRIQLDVYIILTAAAASTRTERAILLF